MPPKVKKIILDPVWDSRLLYLHRKNEVSIQGKGNIFGVTIGDKQYNYNPKKITKTLDKELSKLTIENRNVDDRLKFLIANKNAKLEYKEKKGVITIGGKEYNYNPDKITKALDKTLDKLTNNNNRYKATVAITNVYNKVIQGHLTKALKSYSTLHYKAKISETTSAFDGFANAYTITNISLKGYDGLSYIKYQYNKLLDFLNTNPSMMIQIDVTALFRQKRSGGESHEITVESRIYIVNNVDELKDSITNMPKDVITLFDKADMPASNLDFEKILSMSIHYNRYNPTRGGSYIELPEWIANKKACINIKNEDNKCFKYSILCATSEIYKKEHPERVTHYTKLKENNINWNHMAYPVGNRDIDKFEETNNGLVSVNVYEVCDKLNSKSIIIHRRTKTFNAKYHIHLLKIYSDTGKFHYVYIKDYNKLIGSQTNKNHDKLFHCPYCQHGFKRENLLHKHLTNGCLAITGQSVELPTEGARIKFLNNNRKFKCPFVIYADFECITSKMEGGALSNSNVSSTIKYQHHTPTGFKINIVNSITNTTETFIHRGEDCMDVFFKKIKEVEDNIMELMKVNKEIEMTEQDTQDFNVATKCYICNGEFETFDKKRYKVRDHCHLTGKYRGCAHDVCNLHFNFKNFKIPVFFHNLKNYDSHLIVSNGHKSNCKKKIDVIALNSEKFISIGFGHILYKDSLGFLPLSLERLVKLNKYMNINGQEVLRQNWQENFKFSKEGLSTGERQYVKTDYDLDLLTDKGVYPYYYMDNWGRFEETTLPPKEAFYSKLSNEHISDADYERAQTVWKHLKLKIWVSIMIYI
jgi:hypothetical protein